MKKFYIFIFLLISLSWCNEIIAQSAYIKPCYSVDAGTDVTFCSPGCSFASKIAKPQYINRATTTYQVIQMTLPAPAYNVTGNNVIVDLDDIWSGTVNIGFNFCFFGNTYNRLVIGANGLVSFNTAYAGAYCNWSFTGGIPDAAKPINSIMGPYMDIDPSIGFNANRINYYTEGSYPCRRFVINFYDVPLFSGTCNSRRLRSQIILHEAYNIVDVVINRKDVCTSWNGGRSIIGIQNAAGNMAFAPAGHNPSTGSTNNECWRFLPNGAVMQTINWTTGGAVVATDSILSYPICPTSTTNFVANLVNQRCDGTTVIVSDDVNFTINQLPTADAGIDKVIGCLAPNVVIGTPAIAGNSYTWTPAAGLNNPAIAQPTATANGTYTVTVRNLTTNCQLTDAVTVTSNTTPPAANAGPDKVLSCSGLLIGSPPVAGNTYSWSPAAGLDDPTLAQPTATLPNTYTLTVTNTANSCTATDVVTVTGNINIPTANAGIDKTLTCSNPSLIIGSAAIAGNSYTWSPAAGLTNATIAQPNATAPGTYTLTVTNTTSGCAATDDVTISQDITPPSANAGIDQTLTCTNTSLQIGTAAIAGNTYAWSPAAGLSATNIAQPNATAPGTYTLLVTNTTNGCTSTDNVTIAQNITPPTANAGIDKTLTCTNTSLQIGTAAIAGNTYAWSPSLGLDDPAIAQPTATAPGTYTVTVTNTVNGCTSTDAVTVSQNITPPVANAGPDKTLTCTNTSLQIGTAVIAGNTYAWSPVIGLTNASIAQSNATAPGTYTVTVTNTANGCSSSNDVTVFQDITPPVANAGADKILTCSNPALVIGTAAVAGNTYTWSPSAGLSVNNIAQPTASAPATYTVTVIKTSNGCSASDAVTVSRNITPPAANAGADKLLTCTNTSFVIGTAAIAGNTYAWSPAAGLSAANIAQPNATAPNSYTVTVTNTVNGCTSTDAVIVSQDITPPLADAGTDKTLTCTNTSLQIGTAAIAGNAYAWSPAAGLSNVSIAQPNATAPGTYTVTVTNSANGCTASNDVTVFQNITPPLANAGTDKILTCTNTALVIGTPTVAGNTYSWSPSAGLSVNNIAQPTATAPATYTLTVTKSLNGCVASDVVTVSQNITPPVANTGADKTLTCTNTSLQIGTAAIAGNTYAWSPAAGLSATNIAQPNAFSPGTYTLLVTNTTNGCTSTDNVTIAQDITPPTANAGIDKTLTCTNTSLQIGTAAIAGNTYAWSPSLGLDDPAIDQPTATAPGTYTVTVTNTTNGCTSTDAVTVSQNITPPAANAGPDKTLTCTNTSLQIGTAVIAGNTYAWSPAAGLTNASIAQPNATAPGTYTVTVTNTANGCSSSNDVTVFQDITPPAANAGADKILTCSNPALVIGTAAVAGNTYTWSPSAGLSVNNIAQPTASAPATYTVTVIKTSNGCSASDAVTVSRNITPPAANAGADKLLTCSNTSFVIGTAAIAGNTYAWSPAAGLSAANIAQPNATAPNTYTVTVTNTVNGCTSTDAVIISQDITPPLADAGTDKTLTCTNTSLQIGTAAIAGNAYTWSPAAGLTNASIAQPNATAPGTYTVTVTNSANGCSATNAVLMSIDTVRPLADAGTNKTLTCATTSVTIGSAAISGNTYSWFPVNGLNNPAIAQPVANLLNNYTVTVTNTANGCKSSDEVIIFQNITTSQAAAGDDLTLTCANQSFEIGIPATPGNSYSWSPSVGLNNPSTAQPIVSKPGTYTLTVTNLANGCTAEDVINIRIDTLRPTANAGIDKTLNCAVFSQTIGSAAISGNAYSWQPSAGLNNTSIAQPVANATGSYTLSVTKASNGCISTDNVNILIDTIKPIADAGPDQTFGCPHAALTIGSSALPNMSYVWLRSSGLNENNIAQPSTDTSGIYVLAVVNTVNHCKSSPDTVVISPKNCDCIFYVPTAFSPNNDGVNDILAPFKDCDDYRDLSFSIFNRWGELVFNSHDIIQGWNGIYKDESQQVDSYVWTLEYFDILYNTGRFQKGIVTLLK